MVLSALNLALVSIINEERSSDLIVKWLMKVSFFNKLSITEGRNDSVKCNR